MAMASRLRPVRWAGPEMSRWPEVASSANTRVLAPSPCSGTERKVDISARNPGVDALARLWDSTACRCAAALAPVMVV